MFDSSGVHSSQDYFSWFSVFMDILFIHYLNLTHKNFSKITFDFFLWQKPLYPNLNSVAIFKTFQTIFQKVTSLSTYFVFSTSFR